jgi:hypothetical protein
MTALWSQGAFNTLKKGAGKALKIETIKVLIRSSYKGCSESGRRSCHKLGDVIHAKREKLPVIALSFQGQLLIGPASTYE